MDIPAFLSHAPYNDMSTFKTIIFVMSGYSIATIYRIRSFCKIFF